MGFVDEILDKTTVLPTTELVISEGFRDALACWLSKHMKKET